MQLSKGLSVFVLLAMLGACGGGGGDPGRCSFGADVCGGESGSGDGDGISDVSNGQPSQRRISMAAEETDLKWHEEEVETKVTVTVGSTSGNPIASGTVVQFVTEAGVIGKSCTIAVSADPSSSNSWCSVDMKSTRAGVTDDKVSVLAWLVGEEAYVDLNANGRYDAGEPFWDSGEPFLDKDESGTFDSGIDELVVSDANGSPIPGRGDQPCDYKGLAGHEGQLGPYMPQSKPNTCDGKWGKTLIRIQQYFTVTPPAP